LPPVQPPSGKFIVELFLVPGLIVGLVVCLLLLANWFLSGPQTPEAFLKRLDDPNMEVRWRAASDLAQVLPRNDKLAANPDFALQLAERLQQAIQDSAADEQALAVRLPGLSPAEAERQGSKLRERRNYISYLTLAQGGFLVPVGVPLLRQIAEDDSGPEKMETHPHALRRRQAVAALAGLMSHQFKRFDKLSGLDKTEVVLQLEALAEKGEHSEWVRQARDFLRRRQEGKADALGVDATLEKCARAEDPVLREFTAQALFFWQGTAEENERMEATLERLSRDDGKGEDHLIAFSGPNPNEVIDFYPKPGIIIRINAAQALAHRGSPRAGAMLDLYRELLDEGDLNRTILLQDKSGSTQPSQGKILGILHLTLDVLAELHKQRPDLDFSSLRPSIDRLAGHADPTIQKAASDLQKALDGR